MHLCYKHASSGVLNMSKVKGSCERVSGSMVQGFRGGLSVQTRQRMKRVDSELAGWKQIQDYG